MPDNVILNRLQVLATDMRNNAIEAAEDNHPKMAEAYRDAAQRVEQIIAVETETPEELEANVIQEAHEIIHGERLKHYGHPKLNFERIAKGWEQYFGHEVSMMDVASCMIILKVMRMTEGYHRDSVIDIAGYAALMAVVEGDDEL